MSRSIKIVISCLVVIAVHAAIGYGRDSELPGSEIKVGFLIPSQCRPSESTRLPDGPYDAWPAPHTTECALQPGCIESGYGLWVMEEEVFYRFDAAGQRLALDYFQSTERTSYNKVEIAGVFSDRESTIVHRLASVD